MKLSNCIVGASATLAAFNAPAFAQLPTPSQTAANSQAQAYLFYAGAGDIFEITTSMMAVQKSRNPQVRELATMIIGDHTGLTNTALPTAASAGVMPPPAELTDQQKAQIGQLAAAQPADFDRVYLQLQAPAHQKALDLNRGYARNGDVPSLRQAAQAAVPVIEGHLARVQQMMSAMR